VEEGEGERCERTWRKTGGGGGGAGCSSLHRRGGAFVDAGLFGGGGGGFGVAGNLHVGLGEPAGLAVQLRQPPHLLLLDDANLVALGESEVRVLARLPGVLRDRHQLVARGVEGRLLHAIWKEGDCAFCELEMEDRTVCKLGKGNWVFCELEKRDR